MKKRLFTLFTCIITGFSVYCMFQINRMKMIVGSELSEASNSFIEDDSYVGYIFDDYNINVNLNFRDKVEKNVNSNNIEPISELQDGSKKGVDVMSIIRSEKVIEERALKDIPTGTK